MDLVRCGCDFAGMKVWLCVCYFAGMKVWLCVCSMSYHFLGVSWRELYVTRSIFFFISGATITSKGLESFLIDDLRKYEPFFLKVRDRDL